jgi:hypothetical protein
VEWGNSQRQYPWEALTSSYNVNKHYTGKKEQKEKKLKENWREKIMWEVKI